MARPSFDCASIWRFLMSARCCLIAISLIQLHCVVKTDITVYDKPSTQFDELRLLINYGSAILATMMGLFGLTVNHYSSTKAYAIFVKLCLVMLVVVYIRDEHYLKIFPVVFAIPLLYVVALDGAVAKMKPKKKDSAEAGHVSL
ncbi:hypothetical protein HDE_09853 [Halotydeus destructor]|nr:hypothetical protein HDE_09853 [Halotydeus destructor]